MKNVKSLIFDIQTLKDVFPFLIVLNKKLEMIHTGRSIAKIIPNFFVGDSFSQHFSINRPKIEMKFDRLKNQKRSIFFLQIKKNNIKLRGDIRYEKKFESLVFLGSPWFTDIKQSLSVNLKLNDFTSYDPMLDFLFTLQAKNIALEDGIKFNKELAEKSKYLEKAMKLLEHQKNAAEAANKAKSTFIANMSHELRTPINTITLYSELIEEEASDSGHNKYIRDTKKIQESSKHLLNLINDILDISKIESGNLDLYLESFDIFRMIKEIEEEVRPLAQNKNNSLDVFCPKHIGKMKADIIKIRQSIMNLLSNAVKFTKDGKIKLEVASDHFCEREFITFSIIDTGIGIRSEQLESLFSPFIQADLSTTREFGGTGLGLSISQKFCESMGGEITVKSELDKGSVFTMKIPKKVKQALSRGITEKTEKLQDRKNVHVSPASKDIVLVIDNNNSKQTSSEISKLMK